MVIKILTKKTQHHFLKSLLEDIKEIVKDIRAESTKRLKSKETKKLLNIYPCAMQNLRINGTLLTYIKIAKLCITIKLILKNF